MNSKTKGSGSAHELPSGRNTGLPNNQQQEQERERDFVIENIRANGLSALYYASDALKGNKDIMRVVVTLNGMALSYASAALRDDREIVIVAVKQNWKALQYAPARLKDDKEIVMKAVKNNWCALVDASTALKGDREIVMVAVKQNGWALQYASLVLKGDKEIVMEAVKQNWEALQYASARLKDDKEIVMKAVKQTGRALYFAWPGLRNGGLREYLNDLRRNVFNVPRQTFIATILFGAKTGSENGLCDNSACVLSMLRPSVCLPANFSLQVKRLIWEYAGVRSGPRWELIDGAFSNLPNL
jgi:hypothetical protein